MRPHFSEFSYGFALSHEMCLRYHHFQAAPDLPSLSSEGDSGYDISFPLFALFLQFKRSQYLLGANAKQMPDMGAPYYRAELWQRDHSNQHRLLVELANAGNTVLYACSAFYQPWELDQCFRSQTTEVNTAFFDPSDIGELQDDEPHCIAFKADTDFGIFFSEPRRIQRYKPEDLLRKRRGAGVLTADLLRTLISIYNRVARPSRPLREDDSLYLSTSSPLARAGLLSRVLFNCELLVTGSPNSAAPADQKAPLPGP